MSIYGEIGVKPIINLWGTATRLVGALMDEQVVDAMAQAAKESVLMEELQAAASTIIAELTGAEAGYITCGAASGLTLGTAACLSGLDVSRMERLPDTNGMPNEVIMAREQRCGYDHAIRAAGAKIVEVGYNESLTGALRSVEIWEFEAAITDKTAAIALIFYVWDPVKERQLIEVAKMAKKHDIPVIVDAAGSVPPIDNLKRFVSAGADLVTFSGGKAIRGPQNSGILCGRRDLIASVALQQLDAAGFSELWDPPATLIPREKLMGQPRQGIGRAHKVSKEALVGLLIRLRHLTKEKTIVEAKRMELLLERIENAVEGLPVQTAIVHRASEGTGAIPTLKIKMNHKQLGKDAFSISKELRNGDPRLWVNEKSFCDNTLLITAINLDEKLANAVGARLREIFS
jgi:L-seryl-tRNA(Ser) seleniumtransferase